ncbi:MAG: relaxase domain-containing protein [Nocardioides sp.]
MPAIWSPSGLETRGFLAAAFDHRDSRAGDPDLLTHLAISNTIRTLDDQPRWTSSVAVAGARVIHAAVVAASEWYDPRFEVDPVPPSRAGL